MCQACIREVALRNLHPRVAKIKDVLGAIIFANADIDLRDAIPILEREVGLPTDPYERFVLLYAALEALRIEDVDTITVSIDPPKINLGVITGTVHFEKPDESERR